MNETLNQVKGNIAVQVRKRLNVDELIEYLEGQVEWLKANKDNLKNVDKS